MAQLLNPCTPERIGPVLPIAPFSTLLSFRCRCILPWRTLSCRLYRSPLSHKLSRHVSTPLLLVLAWWVHLQGPNPHIPLSRPMNPQLKGESIPASALLNEQGWTWKLVHGSICFIALMLHPKWIRKWVVMLPNILDNGCVNWALQARVDVVEKESVVTYYNSRPPTGKLTPPSHYLYIYYLVLSFRSS